LHSETAITFAFDMKPIMRLFPAHSAAEKASYFRITP
jgi:hypothetical protein